MEAAHGKVIDTLVCLSQHNKPGQTIQYITGHEHRPMHLSLDSQLSLEQATKGEDQKYHILPSLPQYRHTPRLCSLTLAILPLHKQAHIPPQLCQPVQVRGRLNHHRTHHQQPRNRIPCTDQPSSDLVYRP